MRGIFTYRCHQRCYLNFPQKEGSVNEENLCS